MDRGVLVVIFVCARECFPVRGRAMVSSTTGSSLAWSCGPSASSMRLRDLPTGAVKVAVNCWRRVERGDSRGERGDSWGSAAILGPLAPPTRSMRVGWN
ncbi:hypothetical protein NDU88_002411 [Pleurodeles waltl]|uniref:Secreted protein n=1 Tax=Pleurodeles waltl TaxID=8319 RepID=A0AAV7VZ88_PLEWA|nr:hypothetical protein NDU88_002411 [Pleurodeles waltl]